jgi:methionine aminopeptidase
MECKDGDLILLDVGAEYANYSSDLTRTFPVNGKFTERQKQIYKAVLDMKNFATSLLVPGGNWYDYHKECGEYYNSLFVEIGLLDKADVQNEDKNSQLMEEMFSELTKPNKELIEMINNDVPIAFFISKLRSITKAGTIKKPPPAPIIPVIIPTAMP